MANSSMFMKKVMLMSLGVALMTVLVTAAKADDHVTRNHTFDLSDIKDVEFDNSVGSIDVVPATGNEMRVVLDIEPNEHGFFHRRPDVEDMDLESRTRGDTLILEFDEHNVNADWVVEMPPVDHTEVNIGVGEVRMEVADTELDIKAGVGDVTVKTPLESAGRIRLKVGVGDASLRGGDIIDRHSAFISESVRGEGKGDNSIEIELGVGDINVRLQ